MNALSSSVADLKTNRCQWKAFTTEGHCVVLAPPGSGKTKLLTTRMAYDLSNKIPRPQGAACITLTNAAADELRRRVEALGVEDRSNLFIGTVHSFVLRKIIEPFARAVGRPELTNIAIASKAQKDTLLKEAIAESFPYEDTWLVKSTIEISRQRLATDEDWALVGDRVHDAAIRYEEKLTEHGLHDFERIIAIAVELTEGHRAIRRVLTAQFPHLYVDEYQDLAPGLDRVVKALCFDYRHNCELFAVGDPDQALFGFTGTRPELLQELAERSDVRRIDLEENYRCGEEIIRVANLMRKGRPPMVGHRPGGHVSSTVCAGGMQDQYAHVVNAALLAYRRGAPLHEIAVLCPTRVHCTDATAALRDAGLATFFRDADDYRLTAVTGFVEAAASWVALGRELSDYRLGDLLRRWRSILGGRWTRSDNTALAELLLKYGEQSSPSASALMEEMMSIGLRQALTQVNLAEDVPEVARMCAIVERLSVFELAERVRRQDRVEVTTMTSSKGLEFDVVLIVGADEETIPHYLSNTPEKLAEDRRKFYVSITRARNELRVFYSGFAITKYGRRKNVGPSRYLREIGLA